MTLFFRLLLAWLTARFRSRASVLGPCRTPFRVWPGDLDVLFHVNNGVYLSMLDAARLDFVLRAGVFSAFWRRGVYPVVAAETIRFRRSLRLFQRFEVETRVVGWDEQALVLTHQFVCGGEPVADAVIRWRFLKRRGGKANAAEVLEVLGVTGPSPALPDFIASWNEYNRGPRSETPGKPG